MSRLATAGRRWWKQTGVLTKLWAGCVAAAVAAAMALVGTSAFALATGATAAGHPSAGTSSPLPGRGDTSAASGAAGSANGTGMPGMPGMAANAATGGTAASSVCPNVTGATVMADGMVMAPVPSGRPTPAEQAAADRLVNQVTAGIEKYTSLAAAQADGYVPITPGRGPTTHYLNAATVRSRDVLDPSHPSSLVYANTVDGPVLIGAMFLGPAPCQPGPDIGGPLTQWHAHDNLCFAGGRVVGQSVNGVCASGQTNPDTYFMMHVWTAPSIAGKYQFQADLPRSAYAQVLRTGQP